MSNADKIATPLAMESADAAAALARLRSEHQVLQTRCASQEKRIAWLEKQLFGVKSERRIVEDGTYQMSLGEAFAVPGQCRPPEKRAIPAHERLVPRKNPLADAVCETGLRFGAQVPVEEIRLDPPEIAGLPSEGYEIIEEKVTHKLAQQPGAYVVLRYIQPVVKLKDGGALVSAPAPAAVLEKSYADVSLLAGMLIDKFVYHQPLYRQHQKLAHNGIVLARGTLTTTVQRAIGLLEPIYEAQFASVLASEIVALDETPAKVGREQRGKMKTGYFWPLHGDRDEVVFPFFNNRRHGNVPTILKDFRGILLTDGYAAYERYVAKQKQADPEVHMQQAHCWIHLRRQFLDSEAEHPQAVATVLEYIRLLYAHERYCNEHALAGEAKHAHRQRYSAPLVSAFFAWLEEQAQNQAFLPKDGFTKALHYALKRRAGFELFLSIPALPLDTNHLERTLRVIPMGRKNWHFCWTELGARQVGIIQSLLTTCTLQNINAYDYLVDVLQRISEHPASRVHELTPREWKVRFAADPLRSPLHRARAQQSDSAFRQ